MKSRSPISRFDSPDATSAATSRSRGLNAISLTAHILYPPDRPVPPHRYRKQVPTRGFHPMARLSLVSSVRSLPEYGRGRQMMIQATAQTPFAIRARNVVGAVALVVALGVSAAGGYAIGAASSQVGQAGARQAAYPIQLGPASRWPPPEPPFPPHAPRPPPRHAPATP